MKSLYFSNFHPVACAVATCMALNAYAATSVSNIDEAISSWASFSSTSWIAASFTTDDLAYTLNSVSMPLVTTNGFSTITPHVYADTAGAPTGSPLETLPSIALHYAGMTGFNSAGLNLAPNTTYWVALQGSGPGFPHWLSTLSTSQTGSWTIGDVGLRSNDSGGSWSANEIGRFQVHATPVPEPSVIGLTALGGLAMAFRRARQQILP